MSKTPDEIKKGLECCQGVVRCESCPYQPECDLPFGDLVEADALAYIQQLEADACNWEIEATPYKRQIEQLERERDALMADIKEVGPCEFCKHSDLYAKCMRVEYWCNDCDAQRPCVCADCEAGFIKTKWEWRGVKETRTGASDGCTGLA